MSQLGACGGTPAGMGLNGVPDVTMDGLAAASWEIGVKVISLRDDVRSSWGRGRGSRTDRLRALRK